MYLAELGARIRQARKSRGLTQAVLAGRAGVTRETLNQLERGVAKDLGVAKVLRLLRAVDLDLLVLEAATRPMTNYVRLAATAGSTGFREPLAEEEVVHALLTAKAPARKRPHLRRLLEDSSPALIQGLVSQVSQWGTPAELQQNLTALARTLDVKVRPEWTKVA
jgi:transcriptional regulator with XRE-family HTH domain